MYEGGRGVGKDNEQAVKWMTRAAEQGFAAAEYDLGRMFYNGRLGSKNFTEAYKWFSRAAEQGNAAAQYGLSIMYVSGRGVETDHEQAYVWAALAAANGGNTKLKNDMDKKMSPVFISKARKRVQDCIKKEYKSC